MDAQQIVVTTAAGGRLAVTRRLGEGPAVVLLHAGVADSRSWTGVAEALGEEFETIAYDRRGFGASPTAEDESAFTHVGDLIEVLDALQLDEVFLVGNSMGGGLAIDAALLYPDRVMRVLLLGSAVTGMTDDDTPFDWQPDAASAPLIDRATDESLSTDAQIQALAHLWLDGPAAAEGRVGGAPRALFESMNRIILDVGASDSAGASDTDAWTRLGDLTMPVVSAWGELDLACDLPFYEESARRIGQGPGRLLPGVAHLPGLERPDLVARLIRDTAAG